MRSTRVDAEANTRIYDLAWKWASETLPEGGSILTPGARIWTQENLLELKDRFVDHPDLTPGKSFLDKLQGQLRDASPDVVQLMVEMHLPYFWWVWEGAISASKKVSDLNAILSWHPNRPTLPPDVVASMRPGFAHPGQWAMTRRDTQLTSLIHVTIALVSERRAAYDALLLDPFTYRDCVMNVPTNQGDAAKLGLLNLVFPDTFEDITSLTHKQSIVARFAEYAQGEDDVDRALLLIRAALESTYGKGFDFYSDQHDTLVHLWSKDTKAWKGMLRWLARVWSTFDTDRTEREFKVRSAEQLGAGRAALIAGDADWFEKVKSGLFHGSNLLSWRTGDIFNRWATSHGAEAAEALIALWNTSDGRSELERIDAFAVAIRAAELTTTGAAVNVSSVLLMASDPESHPPVKVGMIRKVWRLAGWGSEPKDCSPGVFVQRAYALFDELLRDTTGWEHPMRDRLDVQSVLWVLASLNERPESWSSNEWDRFVAFQDGVEEDPDVPPSDDELIEEEGDEPPTPTIDYIAAAATDLHVDRGFLDKIVTLLEDKRQVVFYGPPGTGKTFVAKRLAQALVEEDPSRTTIVQFHPATTYEDFFEGLRPTLDGGSVHYELRRGPLSQIAKKAASDPDHRYVMVIDELNRANLPKVFGELLFLLEYRSDPVATLYRPTEKFELPQNLSFIATMNTADRSVALVDAALRRRFHFIPFFPHIGEMKGLLRRWLGDLNRDTAVADLLDAVNDELRREIGDHLVIGPSHFMKQDLSEEALERIWEFNIYPTLEELMWGRTEELDRWTWTAVRRRYASALHLPIEAESDPGLIENIDTPTTPASPGA